MLTYECNSHTKTNIHSQALIVYTLTNLYMLLNTHIHVTVKHMFTQFVHNHTLIHSTLSYSCTLMLTLSLTPMHTDANTVTKTHILTLMCTLTWLHSHSHVSTLLLYLVNYSYLDSHLHIFTCSHSHTDLNMHALTLTALTLSPTQEHEHSHILTHIPLSVSHTFRLTLTHHMTPTYMCAPSPPTLLYPRSCRLTHTHFQSIHGQF